MLYCYRYMVSSGITPAAFGRKAMGLPNDVNCINVFEWLKKKITLKVNVQVCHKNKLHFERKSSRKIPLGINLQWVSPITKICNRNMLTLLEERKTKREKPWWILRENCRTCIKFGRRKFKLLIIVPTRDHIATLVNTILTNDNVCARAHACTHTHNNNGNTEIITLFYALLSTF